MTITKTTILGFSANQVVATVGALASVAAQAFPGTAVLGMSLDKLLGLAIGVANQVPAAIDAWNEIQALGDSGTAPSPEVWARLNAAADQAHAEAQAAADEVIAKG